MSIEDLQRRICGLIAEAQRNSPGGYLAGGIALQESLSGDRLSEDIDRFHDTPEENQSAFERDSAAMINAGLRIDVLHKEPNFIKANVSDETGDITRVDWARDSAYRFFSLQESPRFGNILSPLDLATNKTLAMVGRLEPRDWLDMILCHERLQPLGLLAYAACGKDPGYSPSGIVELGARFNRFSVPEFALAKVRFRSNPPGLDVLHRKWHAMIDEARLMIEVLPPAEAGQCVMMNGQLFRGTVDDCRRAALAGKLEFRAGRLGSIVGVPKPAYVHPEPFDFG